jgi:hypothetical protein
MNMKWGGACSTQWGEQKCVQSTQLFIPQHNGISLIKII